MDIALHYRVLSRHRRLVGAGLLAAVVLALLAFVRVGPDGIAYREQETWRSMARLFATQGGYLFSPSASASTADGVDPTTFAIVAAEFANSDAVIRPLERDGELEGEVVASAGRVEGNYLPFVDVAGIASTPAASKDLASRAAAAISAFVRARQARSGVKPSRRILLELINAPEEPELLEGRSKTLPIMVFLGVMSLVLGAVYVRENVELGSRRPRAESEPEDAVRMKPPVEVADQSVESRVHVQLAGRPRATLGSQGSEKPGRPARER